MPGGTEPALDCSRLDERLLQDVKLVAVRQALDGGDLASCCLGCQQQA